MQYLRARYYNSSIGGFITRDTYTGILEKPLTQNLYTYTENNPINFIDPSGHNFLKDAWNGIKDTGKAIVDGVKAVGKAIADGAKDLYNGAKEKVTNAYNKITNSGNSSSKGGNSGVAPVRFSSAGKGNDLPSKQGNRRLQAIFYFLAIQMIQVSPKGVPRNEVFREYYIRRTSEGKNKKQVLICISRRLVNIIYGMLKSKTEYRDPSKAKINRD